MSLIHQEICCSKHIKCSYENSWRLVQETSEEKLFIKSWQIARWMSTIKT